MKIYIIDASVVIASLVEGSVVAKRLFTKILKEAKKGRLKVVSLPLLALEVGNVLRYKALDEKKRKEVFQIFCQLPIEYVNLDLGQVEEVVQQAVKFGTSVYDMAYHFLALGTGGEFLTCDKNYFQKAKTLGSVRQVNP